MTNEKAIARQSGAVKPEDGAGSRPLTRINLVEIAERISAHLKRIERDKALNPTSNGGMGTRPYFEAYAWRAGKYVIVRYVSYQGSTSLRHAEALRYLTWLDAGNVGKHWAMPPLSPLPRP